MWSCGRPRSRQPRRPRASPPSVHGTGRNVGRCGMPCKSGPQTGISREPLIRAAVPDGIARKEPPNGRPSAGSPSAGAGLTRSAQAETPPRCDIARNDSRRALRRIAPCARPRGSRCIRLRDSKHGRLALGDMTLVAFHFRMPALERVRSRCMFLQPECGRLEPIHRVASGAIAARRARPSHELTSVIVRMASGAGRMRYRRLEIAACMAVAASYTVRASQEEEGGLGMIEAF